MKRLAVICLTVACLVSPAHAQAPRSLSDDYVSAANVCLKAMLNGASIADTKSAAELVQPASQQAREKNPLAVQGGQLFELRDRADGVVTILESKPKLCSVFVVGADSQELFDALTKAVTASGDLVQREPGKARDSHWMAQRNFRSANGNVTLELEGSIGDRANNLTMAHFGRRK